MTYYQHWMAKAEIKQINYVNHKKICLLFQFPSEIKQPIQAGGIRRSRALPYELHTSARCQLDGSIKLLFSNTGTQAAVFHVYDQLNPSRVPRRYIVEAVKI